MNGDLAGLLKKRPHSVKIPTLFEVCPTLRRGLKCAESHDVIGASGDGVENRGRTIILNIAHV
jgi:hypothetical protein